MKKLALVFFINLFVSGPVFASCPDGFRSVISGRCITTYQEWIGEVWSWAMMIMIPISVLILSAAGVLYMVSEGDSNRISLAKKLIIGVFSGVGLLVLARLLLTIIGVEGHYNV